MTDKWKLKLRTKLTLLVCSVTILSLLVTSYFTNNNVESTVIEHLEEKARDAARTAALSAVFIDGLEGEISGNEIQIQAENMRKAINVRFIVLLNMDGVRLSHPLADKIGEKYVGGDAGDVFKGEEQTSIATGTLGRSLRHFTPVYNEDGTQIGAVLVGILLNDVNEKVNENTQVILFNMIIGILIGLIGAIFLAKKIKTILFNMEPFEVAHLLQQRSAMLMHAREGVVAIDEKGEITLMNEEAKRLLNQVQNNEYANGKDINEILPQLELKQVIDKGHKKLDQEYNLGEVIIIANTVPLFVKDRIAGAVITFRDKTEISHLQEQLSVTKLYAEALRAQTHEFMNKLHVILGLVQMKSFDQLADYVKKISNHFQSEVGFITARIKEPVIAGFIVGKMSYAREQGASLILTENSTVQKPLHHEQLQDLITILGNLIDNAIDSIQHQSSKKVFIDFEHYNDHVISIKVKDTGSGIEKENLDRILQKGFSTKGVKRGFGLYLVQQLITKNNGHLTIRSEVNIGTEMHAVFSYRIRGVEHD